MPASLYLVLLSSPLLPFSSRSISLPPSSAHLSHLASPSPRVMLNHILLSLIIGGAEVEGRDGSSDELVEQGD